MSIDIGITRYIKLFINDCSEMTAAVERCRKYFLIECPINRQLLKRHNDIRHMKKSFLLI